MDPSQDPCFRSLHILNTNDKPDSRRSGTLPSTFDITASTPTDFNDRQASLQHQNSHQATGDSSTSGPPSRLTEPMALLLPPGPSPVAAQWPFATATPTASLTFAGFDAHPSGLVDRAFADLSSLSMHVPDDMSSATQLIDFASTSVDRSGGANSQGWTSTSPLSASTTSGSLGLFFPSDNQISPTTDGISALNPHFQLHQQPLKPTTTIPRSLPSSFSSLNRQVFDLRPCHPPLNLTSEQGLPMATAAVSTTSATGMPAPHQMFAYKQSLTNVHTERLGGLLGLQHPLPPIAESQNQGKRGLALDADHTPSHHCLKNNRIDKSSPMTSMPQIAEATRVSELPRDVDDLILIVDRDDNIVWTSDSMRACAGMLSDAGNGITGPNGTTLGWNTASLGSQRIKVAFLLADEFSVSWWQQACYELRSMCTEQRHSLQQQTDRDSANIEKSPHHYKRELFLRHRSQRSEDKFIEMTIVATRDAQAAKDGLLMVRLRTASVPTIASVSSQAMLGSVNSGSPFRTSPPVLRDGRQSLAAEDAELRLLVSRNGLILRATFPTDCRGPSTGTDSMQNCSGARAIIALLGEGASMPAFGQSLVDVPRLAPLLHVIAQASVVGLAQTVKLKAGGRQITATVQPVLRRPTVDTDGLRKARLPAAKVWITLSAPATVTRRSSSAMSKAMTGLGGTSSGIAALAQPVTPQQRSVALDRRHSEQVLRQNSPHQATSWPPASNAQAGTSALIPSPFTHAAVAHEAPAYESPSFGRGKGKGRREESAMQRTPMLSPDENRTGGINATPVNDSLSLLMANLEEENRNLRRQIEACRRRRQEQAQPFSRPSSQPFSQPFAQPFAQSFAQPFTPPQWRHSPLHPLRTAPLLIPPQSPLSVVEVPGSCPTNLVYLA